MLKRLLRFLDFIGYGQTVQAVIQAQFVRTLLFPTLASIMTGGAGLFGGIPLMWVFTATAVTFGATMVGVLRGSEYVQKKNPEHKLALLGPEVAVDLVPTDAPLPTAGNRHQRRTQSKTPSVRHLASNQLSPGVDRQIERAVIGVTVINTATFPISAFIQSSETELADNTPPRVTFPKDQVLIHPGTPVTFRDERIPMNGIACGRLAGKMDFHLRYGLPGKENFELHLKGALDVQMEKWGMIIATHVKWTD